jgi:chemotaxis protein histidine kinase CheA
MSVAENEVDQWAHWQSRVYLGQEPGCTEAQPQSGYYRSRNEPVFIWQEGGAFCATRGAIAYRAAMSGDPSGVITHRHKIDELWNWCHAQPVTSEAFQQFIDTEAWPDQEPVAADSKRAVPETPEDVLAWVEKLRAKVPAAVEDEDTAKKAADLADAATRLEATADDLRKAEKEPHLKASRDVDARWKPAIAAAEALKKFVKNEVVHPWNMKKAAKIAAERAAEAERARKAAEEAKAAGDALAAAQAQEAAATAERKVAEPIKVSTGGIGRRTYAIAVAEDIRAALRWYAERNEDVPEDIAKEVTKHAKGLMELGNKVPGMRLDKGERSQ